MNNEDESILNAAPSQTEAPEEPKKKKSKAWIFVLIALLLIGAGVAIFFLFFFNKGDEELRFEKKEPEPEAYTAAYKLAIDYEAGAITTDEYVKQLTYTEYDSSKLDEKYKSDKGALGDNNINTIIDLLKNHSSEISAETRKEFTKHFVLADVTFGENKKTAKADSDVVLAAKDTTESESYLTTLDKVILSENGNFLIWYTESGDSKITTAQAQKLASSLESSIKKYTEITGYEYEFESVEAEDYDTDKKLAKERLAAASNIPKSKLLDAMNVYVLDTKSERTLATYNYLTCDSSASNCNFLFSIGNFLDSGAAKSSSVAWPYIEVNSKSMDSEETATQVINHELFHHYQNKLICKTDSVAFNYCKGGDDYYEYTEAQANYFSSKVSGGADFDNILNRWSGRFSQSSYVGLKNIANGGNYGYGQWPFYYSYEKYVDGGLKSIIEAHKKSNPYEYLSSKTTTGTMKKVMNEAAYYSLSKDYPIDPMKNDWAITYEEEFNGNLDSKFYISGGAIQYFKLGSNWTVAFTTIGSDATTSAVLMGKKDGKYSVLKTATASDSFDSGAYSGYSDFVLAVTNADLLEEKTFVLKYTEKDDPNAISLRHRYNNYAVEYNMSINMGGIKTTATGKGRVDERHQRSYLETHISTLLGMTFNMVSYSDFYNGVDYYTNPTDSLDSGLGGLLQLLGGTDGNAPKWLKTKSASRTIDIGIVMQKLRDAKQSQKIDDHHYKVKMSAKEMYDLMNTANSADSTKQFEFSNGTIQVDVFISEFGYIEKLDYDFSSLVEGIDEFTCTMKLYDYNRAGDVLIPESIRYGAVEE